MILSPNCFALQCAGPFHKTNAGYEATTTTVNSSCLMYGYYIDAILLNYKGAACATHVRMRVAAFIREPLILNMDIRMYRDAPCEKSWKQGNPLSNTSKDTSTIMRNPPYIVQTKHDCASILDSIAKGISLFPRFFAWCIPTSIFIQ